ncbi:MAG: ureidoglycolate lyase [Spirochaetota bacterium]
MFLGIVVIFTLLFVYRRGRLDAGARSVMTVQIPVGELTQDAFEPFGRLLVPRQGESAEAREEGFFDFFVPFVTRSRGWQIGYLVNRTKQADRLERHPRTPEAFCPLSGRTVLLAVENPEDLDSFSCYSLTHPVVFNPGVWHAVISLSSTSEILIVENQDVTDEFFRLRNTITV